MPETEPVKAQTDEEILFPDARLVKVRNVEFEIYPLPDSVAAGLADALGQVTSLFVALAEINEDAPAPEGAAAIDPRLRTFLPLVNKIVEVLIPNMTAIVAGALRKEKAWVEDRLRYAERLHLLREIVMAEDPVALMGEFQALAGIFQPAQPQAAKRSAKAKA